MVSYEHEEGQGGGKEKNEFWHYSNLKEAKRGIHEFLKNK
jgi:hypothetical protein